MSNDEYFLLRNLPDIGPDGEKDFCLFINNLFAEFLKERFFKIVANRDFQLKGNIYYAILTDAPCDIDFDFDEHYISVLCDKEGCSIDIRFSLHTRTRCKMNKKQETQFLQEYSYNMIKLAEYGLKNLNDDFYQYIKALEIAIGERERYLMLPQSTDLYLEERDSYHGVTIPVFEVSIDFDMIDEESYDIGGKEYEEGKKRYGILSKK